MSDERRRVTDSFRFKARWIGPALVGLASLVGYAWKLGAAVSHNTDTVHILAAHQCRVEEKLNIASFDDCIYDFSADPPVHMNWPPPTEKGQ